MQSCMLDRDEDDIFVLCRTLKVNYEEVSILDCMSSYSFKDIRVTNYKFTF